MVLLAGVLYIPASQELRRLQFAKLHCKFQAACLRASQEQMRILVSILCRPRLLKRFLAAYNLGEPTLGRTQQTIQTILSTPSCPALARFRLTHAMRIP